MVNDRAKRAYHKRHAHRTTKIIDRLGYSPAKHKHKEKKMLRQKLQARVFPLPSKPPEPKTILKFGSFNINGLDLGVNWAINQLVTTRGFDVSVKSHHL